MNVSQTLNHINDNNYDDDITVTDVPKGYFLAVTNNQLPDGSSTRQIEAMLMPLEQAPGGTTSTNSGLYIRGAGETAVNVIVSKDGTEVANNITNYN